MTDPTRDASLRSQLGVVGIIAVIGVGVFVGLVMALHPLRPDLNPTSRYVSEYAVGGRTVSS